VPDGWPMVSVDVARFYFAMQQMGVPMYGKQTGADFTEFPLGECSETRWIIVPVRGTMAMFR
jgi:hypothetical protein